MRIGRENGSFGSCRTAFAVESLSTGESKGIWILNRIDGFDLTSKGGAVRFFEY
jgi:hypothetical protein